MWERPRGSPGKPHEKLGRGPGEAQERPGRRGLGDALQKPRGDPEEAQERPSGKGLGDALQRHKRGPVEAEKKPEKVWWKSESHQRPKNSLGDAS